MKLTVSGKFLKSLQPVLRTLNANSALPELNVVFLDVDGADARLVAFSSSAVVKVGMQARALERACIRMLLSDFERMVNVIGGSEVEVWVDGGFVRFRDGATSGRMPGLAAQAEDYEVLAEKLKLFEFEAAASLSLTVEQVELVSRAARPLLSLARGGTMGNGLWLFPYSGEAGDVTLVGGAANFGMGFVVLGGAVRGSLALDEWALDFARLTETDGRVRFDFSERMVRVGGDSGLVRVGVLPDVGFRVKTFETVWVRAVGGVRYRVEISRDEFADFYEAVMKALRVGRTRKVLGVFSYVDGCLRFEARDDFGGWISRNFRLLSNEWSAEPTGEKVTFWMENVEFLKVFRSERMRLWWSDGRSPLIFSENEGVGGSITAGGGDVWYVVMPCTVDVGGGDAG